ncbi:hypothetical protein DND90_14265 [Pseudomonas syringae pv. maculicola]|nr:hypothetical protein DND90_14265 [Pseudomonas syringae pv. maculicola]
MLCRYADLNYRATLCVVMPFRTLRVLFATQSVESCIPTRGRRNDNPDYRAALHKQGVSPAE